MRSSISRHEPEPNNEPSLGELVSWTIDDAKKLAQAEVQMAKAELRDASRRMIRGMALALMGTVVVMLGLIALLHALAAALGPVVPTWATYLLSGVVALAVAAALGLLAYRRLESMELVPERAIETTKDDIEWMKTKLD